MSHKRGWAEAGTGSNEVVRLHRSGSVIILEAFDSETLHHGIMCSIVENVDTKWKFVLKSLHAARSFALSNHKLHCCFCTPCGSGPSRDVRLLHLTTSLLRDTFQRQRKAKVANKHYSCLKSIPGCLALASQIRSPPTTAIVAVW
jgi:hypothetical protein